MIKSDSQIIPFFSKSINPVFGLNHLGIRNAAEDLFTTLLPGLNGVTERVRYYSFYCWLTDNFRKEHKENDRTDEDFRMFVRKSEMLLALIHAKGNPDITGIPGITYARGTLALGYSIINLVSCVDHPEEKRRTNGTYWANSGGVLRQYYSSSLKDMALLQALKKQPMVSAPSEDSTIPEGSISGMQLAEAFGSSIGNNAAKRFLKCVMIGRVSIEELDELYSPFLMKDFGNIGTERDILIDLLNQKDHPDDESSETTFRYETIKLFLEYCKSARTDGARDSQAFPEYIYNKVLEGKNVDTCSLGWYAYHLNDEWQYFSSEIFSCVLGLIKDGNWVQIEPFSKQLAESMADNLFPGEGLIKMKDVFDRISEGYRPNIDKPSLETEAAAAMYNILSLHCVNSPQKDIVNRYQEAFPEMKKDSFFTFMTELKGYGEIPLQSFLHRYISEKIIFRHHTVSLIKYCQTGVSSNKFLLEDGFIKFISNVEFTHTAPRIDSLIDFLSDLGLLVDMKPGELAVSKYNLSV